MYSKEIMSVLNRIKYSDAEKLEVERKIKLILALIVSRERLM